MKSDTIAVVFAVTPRTCSAVMSVRRYSGISVALMGVEWKGRGLG